MKLTEIWHAMRHGGEVAFDMQDMAGAILATLSLVGAGWLLVKGIRYAIRQW